MAPSFVGKAKRSGMWTLVAPTSRGGRAASSAFDDDVTRV